MFNARKCSYKSHIQLVFRKLEINQQQIRFILKQTKDNFLVAYLEMLFGMDGT